MLQTQGAKLVQFKVREKITSSQVCFLFCPMMLQSDYAMSCRHPSVLFDANVIPGHSCNRWFSRQRHKSWLFERGSRLMLADASVDRCLTIPNVVSCC